MPYYPWEEMLEDLSCRPHFGVNPLPKAECLERQADTYEILKTWTGQDFGYNEEAWRAWMMERPHWTTDPEFDENLEKLVAQRERDFAEKQAKGIL